ncbi:MAG: DUF1353 domain-containing protein [Gammaproteobacteria bacterium]|nr:DUF1353 domain-containing protein [Gammaproteobacteria bacterium]
MKPSEMTPGTFSGPVRVEWLEDDPRKMQLLEELWYKDKSGRLWHAERGSIIDGASIPRFFWRVIGSPFVGKYRRPSVIHDVYCDNHLRPHQEVHDVFDEMMEVENVSDHKRASMFNAVDKFGPKWGPGYD